MTINIYIDWDNAIKHCQEFLALGDKVDKSNREYVEHLLQRYKDGERTAYLYDQMMSDLGE